MKKLLTKIKQEENGTAMVLIAGALIALYGLAAFAVDFGLAYNSKAEAQNAADAAALAGANELPNVTAAINAAYNVAQFNGYEQSEVTVTTPFDGDEFKIEVKCAETVDYHFSRVLGIQSSNILERAVAINEGRWSGDALPFVNLDDDYSDDNKIVAWEKTGPGDFESIDNDDYEIINGDDPETCYFDIDYSDGLVITQGTVALVKQEIGYIYDRVHPDKSVYALSLTSDVIKSGNVRLTDGTFRSLENLKNGDVIDPSQIVLVECLFDYYDYNAKTIYLTVLNTYDIMNNEFPPDYVPPDGGLSRIIE